MSTGVLERASDETFAQYGARLNAERERLTNEAVSFEKKYDGAAMSAEDGAKFEALLNELGQVAEKAIEHDARHGTLENSKRWLQGLGTDGDAAAVAAADFKPAPVQTLGELFTGSDEYQGFVSQFGTGGVSEGWRGESPRFSIEGSLVSIGGAQPRNDLIHTGTLDQNETILPRPRILPMVDEAPFVPYGILDLCTRIPVTGEGFKYPRLTARQNNAAFVNESTTTADFAVADQTPANGYKPESNLQWASATGTVETIAHWMAITRQAAADAPIVVSYIRTFLINGLRQAIDEAVAIGDGNAPNIRGILNAVNPYTNVASVSVGGGNRLNAILSAIVAIKQARPGEFMPNAIVMNSADLHSTEFMAYQDTQGMWAFGSPFGPMMTNPSIWGLRVVANDAMPVGTQLIGDFRYALVADRQSAQIFFADQHKDFFVRNMLVLLAEQRLGFHLIAEQAFAQVVA